MPTRIVFAAAKSDQPLTVHVEEDLNAVHDAWVAAGGLPFPLTDRSGQGTNKVWVNPATVAYFEEEGESGVAFT